jgi:excinuclease UvrABC nuclease subunit
LDDLWQADLAEFQLYAKENKGYRYILIVIDCFSKFLWTRPLKTKSSEDVARAMDNVFKEGRTPKNLQTDQGTEFYNQHFTKLMNKYKINHYSTYSVIKASIVERVIRTLKDRLYRAFSLRGKYIWYDILDNETLQYNSRKHSTIKMRPSDVTSGEKEEHLLKTVYSNIKIAGKPKLHVGDVVRISKQKAAFAKGYTPNWSTELFKISKIKITNPVTYLLEDIRANPIKDAFYEYELQKAKHEDVYLVEKVLRKKGNRVFVKWLGLDNSHSSWIDKSNTV